MNKPLMGEMVPLAHYIPRGAFENDLVDLIKDGRDIALVGCHRFGKSAACTYIASQLDSIPNKQTMYFDLTHLSEPRFRNVVAKITNNFLPAYHISPASEYAGADEDAVIQLASYAKSTGKHLVIIIDEMDVGLDKKAIYHEWNASIRMLKSHLLKESDGGYRVSFLRVLAYPDHFYHERHEPLSSVAFSYVKHMPALTENDARKLYNSMVPADSKVKADFALKYTGTHPYLIDLMASEVNSLKALEPNYTGLLEKVFKQSGAFFNDLYLFLSRNDSPTGELLFTVMALAVRQENLSPAPPLLRPDNKFSVKDMYINDLVDWGLANYRNGELELFSPLFAHWLSLQCTTILNANSTLASNLVSYLGLTDLKTLLSNVKNALAVGTGIAALL